MSATDESRRKFVMLATVGVSALALAARRGEAATAAQLDPNDPAAKALGYVSDVSKLDTKSNPQFKAGSHCGNCAQFNGAATAATAPCNIFPGKVVANNGWCRVWAPKAA